MASITLTFTHPNANYTKTFNLADADMTRMVTAAREVFYHPQRQTPKGVVGDPSPLTGVQALERASRAFFNELRRMTRDYEVKLAAEAAEASISTISET